MLCAKKLEEVGVPRDQAEVHARIMTEIIGTNLATKQDLKDLRLYTQEDIKGLNDKLDSSVERLDRKMIQLENRLVIKLGTIVTIAIATATTVIKLL